MSLERGPSSGVGAVQGLSTSEMEADGGGVPRPERHRPPPSWGALLSTVPLTGSGRANRGPGQPRPCSSLVASPLSLVPGLPPPSPGQLIHPVRAQWLLPRGSISMAWSVQALAPWPGRALRALQLPCLPSSPSPRHSFAAPLLACSPLSLTLLCSQPGRTRQPGGAGRAVLTHHPGHLGVRGRGSRWPREPWAGSLRGCKGALGRPSPGRLGGGRKQAW